MLKKITIISVGAKHLKLRDFRSFGHSKQTGIASWPHQNWSATKASAKFCCSNCIFILKEIFMPRPSKDGPQWQHLIHVFLKTPNAYAEVAGAFRTMCFHEIYKEHCHFINNQLRYIFEEPTETMTLLPHFHVENFRLKTDLRFFFFPDCIEF